MGPHRLLNEVRFEFCNIAHLRGRILKAEALIKIHPQPEFGEVLNDPLQPHDVKGVILEAGLRFDQPHLVVTQPVQQIYVLAEIRIGD